MKDSTPKQLYLNWGQLTTHADSGVFVLSKRSFHYCACKLGLVDMILVERFSFFLPLRMNGMHKTQFDHAHFDLPPLVL